MTYSSSLEEGNLACLFSNSTQQREYTVSRMVQHRTCWTHRDVRYTGSKHTVKGAGATKNIQCKSYKVQDARYTV